MIRMLKTKLRPNAVRTIAKDDRGATAVEFAIVLPIFLTFMVGLFDAGYFLYNRVQLDGVVAKAARDSSLESNIGDGAEEVDNQVKAMMGIAAHNAEFEFKREAFAKFTNTKRKEPWNDGNGNKVCDNGEPYEDINNSSTWDRGAKLGQGGAKDVVVYEVTMTYPRLFPTENMFGIPNEATIRTKTLIANQPYAQQNISQTAVRNCT
jgi:TadE-like protein